MNTQAHKKHLIWYRTYLCTSNYKLFLRFVHKVSVFRISILPPRTNSLIYAQCWYPQIPVNYFGDALFIRVWLCKCVFVSALLHLSDCYITFVVAILQFEFDCLSSVGNNVSFTRPRLAFAERLLSWCGWGAVGAVPVVACAVRAAVVIAARWVLALFRWIRYAEQFNVQVIAYL